MSDKWKQLKAQAAELSGERAARDIWALAGDPRFPAVLALLADVRQERLTAASGLESAGHHGVLAHTMGTIDAIDEVERRMAGMIELPGEHQAGER